MNARKAVTSEGSICIIAAGVKISGDIESDGIVKVEGLVVGNVRADKQVLVAKGGVIEGDIETAEAIVGGEVRGQVQARQRVEVQAGGSVQGDITTPRIVVQEGGEVNGHLRMSTPAAAEAATAALLRP
jgi:cytoskeletal protein CcmA (bactofilin family)